MATVKILSPIFPAGPVRFLGKEGVYWRLRIKGAALVMVTLGIYRFWLATDVRRFLWSNTEIAGDTLEYNGLATELLVGFLLAIAICGAALHRVCASARWNGRGRVQAGDVRHLLVGAARRIRIVPGAALSPDPHGVSRRALRPARLGLELCRRRAVSGGRSSSSRSGSLIRGRRQVSTFQDAQYQLRRSAGRVRRHRGWRCSCAACRSGFSSSCRSSSRFVACVRALVDWDALSKA